MAEDILATLQNLEQRLMQPTVRCDSTQLLNLLADDFVEFGSSGRVFDRAAIVAELAAEPPLRPRTISNFRVVWSAQEAALVSYRSSGPAADGSGRERSSLRSSLWIRESGRWRLRFHQGTFCPVCSLNSSQSELS